jgi:hypothetical protein
MIPMPRDHGPAFAALAPSDMQRAPRAAEEGTQTDPAGTRAQTCSVHYESADTGVFVNGWDYRQGPIYTEPRFGSFVREQDQDCS